MHHRIAGYQLNRNKATRNALRRSLIISLFANKRIKTTIAKANAIRGDAEKLITLAKNSSNGTDIDKVNARRLAAAKLANADAVKKLFDEIAPKFEKRNGGYTRILKLGPRVGDAAEMALLELVEE